VERVGGEVLHGSLARCVGLRLPHQDRGAAVGRVHQVLELQAREFVPVQQAVVGNCKERSAAAVGVGGLQHAV
jgi:hypothetical protein